MNGSDQQARRRARELGLDYDRFVANFISRNSIDPSAYENLDVKRGLRNADGTGVLTGLTNISNVHGYVINEGEKYPDEGRLTLRGYEIGDIIEAATKIGEFSFLKVVYLLMNGKLPTHESERVLRSVVDHFRELPDGFTAGVIMNNASKSIMNMLQRCVTMLYSYDDNAESSEPVHEVYTSLSLISRLPRIMVLAYHAKRARFHGESMIMHRFVPGQSTAETILSMLRPDRTYTHEQAVMLDIMLTLHSEHGGGNNSTFTCRSLTSAGTDPYSAYAGAMGSLKGSKHGGANFKVLGMHRDMEEHIKDWADEGQVADYLRKIVAKEAFDQSGLVYGMGHAVYTLSDPRAVICKQYAENLASGTEFEEEYRFLELVERLAPEVIAEKKGAAKLICANIDMYTGFVYKMLGIPQEMITPIFACSRMAGWSAHRFEELVSGGRIMRPAYKSVSTNRCVELPD